MSVAEPAAGQELARAELGGQRGRAACQCLGEGSPEANKADEDGALRSRKQAEAGALGACWLE